MGCKGGGWGGAGWGTNERPKKCTWWCTRADGRTDTATLWLNRLSGADSVKGNKKKWLQNILIPCFHFFFSIVTSPSWKEIELSINCHVTALMYSSFDQSPFLLCGTLYCIVKCQSQSVTKLSTPTLHRATIHCINVQ